MADNDMEYNRGIKIEDFNWIPCYTHLVGALSSTRELLISLGNDKYDS